MTRAFTLVELIAIVVILIGILTVMAIPTMAEARYNARTFDDATQIAELYRDGRARAMGRGAAMLLQMTSANSIGGANLGTFTLYEAQVGVCWPVAPRRFRCQAARPSAPVPAP